MRFKARYLLEQGEMQQSKGLYIYNDNNDEFAINMTKDGKIIITSTEGSITIEPQAMNQVIIGKKNK